MALRTVASNISSSTHSDEFELGEKIKRKMVRQRREHDAVTFSELHRKLQAQTTLKDRWRILYLLFRLGEDNSAGGHSGQEIEKTIKPSQLIFTPAQSRLSLISGTGSAPMHMTSTTSLPLSTATSSSGIGSSMPSQCSSDAQFAMPGTMQTPHALREGMQKVEQRILPSLVLKLLHGADSSADTSDISSYEKGAVSARSSSMTMQNISASSSSRMLTSARGLKDNTSYDELSENTVLRELIYIFQGIEGKYIRYDIADETFKVTVGIELPKGVRKMVSRLSECGYLYNKIRKYTDARTNDKAFGLVGQSFCAALHHELTEYYRLIAVLEAQIHQEADQGICVASNGLTLRRLSVWMLEPMIRLKTIAALVDICQGKKGGSLASCVHSYMQHGDPVIRSLIQHTLAVVSQPIFNSIIRWIYEGELDDVYHEFFVASDPQVKDERLWHDKYSLRKEMIPSFLNMEIARKILLTGKTIKFLRQICQDRTNIRSRDVVKASETSQVESIFSQDSDGAFQKMIDTVYKETSMHLLQVLYNKYKFLEHLKAMRRYLLLGQGDFIRHLMDLLVDDLAKPAQTLFVHNLTGILETAIRATNAQYDDADILKRLDVRLLEMQNGDTGWDVFSLEYHVSGHIRTVFTTESMRIYLRVFNFLWRAKRMEYILAMSWKEQISNAKMLRSMPELTPMLHQCQLIVSEMLHFVQQIQYYINFEVLECSWDELLSKVKAAEDLDQIIAAHQVFLDTITTRSLLDSRSSEVFGQLRTIFGRIIHFQTIQEKMYDAIREELTARRQYAEEKTLNSDNGDWGVDEMREKAEEERQVAFSENVVVPTRSELRVLALAYQNMVEKFLVMLTKHSDASLRFLSFRLDFNEHYGTVADNKKRRISCGSVGTVNVSNR